MIRIIRTFFSHYSIGKGSIYTLVGLGLIAIAGYNIVQAKTVTDTDIELVILGLTVAGVNGQMLDNIKSRNPNDTPK